MLIYTMLNDDLTEVIETVKECIASAIEQKDPDRPLEDTDYLGQVALYLRQATLDKWQTRLNAQLALAKVSAITLTNLKLEIPNHESKKLTKAYRKLEKAALAEGKAIRKKYILEGVKELAVIMGYTVVGRLDEIDTAHKVSKIVVDHITANKE